MPPAKRTCKSSDLRMLVPPSPPTPLPPGERGEELLPSPLGGEGLGVRGVARCSSNSWHIVSQSTKLERGPTWPPHSRPSKTKRRAPSRRNRESRPGEGTCRYVG